MKDDLSLIVHKYNQNVKSLNIYPIGDTQVGSANFDQELMKNWVKMVKNDPNAAVVIVGDMLNNGLKNSKTNVYREVMTPQESKYWLIDTLKPIADKIIGCVTGNHEIRSVNETDNDPLYDIMYSLGKEDLYRENMAFLKVSLGRKSDDRQYAYTLCLAHGGSKRKTEDFAWTVDNLDIMVTGHTHTPSSSFPAKYVIDTHNECIRRVGFTHIVVPSFDLHGGYALRGLYRPQDSEKIPVIKLDGTRKGIQVLWTDVKYI